MKKKWVAGKFNWQAGYGYFSHSHSELEKVIKYIRNQPKHHTKRSFKDEYLEILHRCDISFEEEYLFEWILD